MGNSVAIDDLVKQGTEASAVMASSKLSWNISTPVPQGMMHIKHSQIPVPPDWFNQYYFIKSPNHGLVSIGTKPLSKYMLLYHHKSPWKNIWINKYAMSSYFHTFSGSK